MNLEFHPVANIFPLLQGEEFEALKADIKSNGLIEPIWLHPDGRIIDGRNRYRACNETGAVPKFEIWNGEGSLIGFVVSLNLRRRHLDSSQRSAIAVEILPMLEEEARERYRETVGRPEKSSQKIDTISSPNDGRATQQAAGIFNTNRQYVSDAKKLKEEAPDIFEQVKAGELSIPRARFAFAERNKVPPPPLKGKYRVIYADPPWKYGNNMPDYYGEQGKHYPLMTVEEVAALPIRDIAEDNAVLFLWVTSPILEESFEVVDAWGFKYKASFVWDKVKHVMGHYNSVRHELLLICVKGSCQPDVQKLFDSVQTIERTGKHSEKPEEFRQIIDTIYPNGNRIELFARVNKDGWNSYGNEPLPGLESSESAGERERVSGLGNGNPGKAGGRYTPNLYQQEIPISQG